jgi:hypothetical protein
MALCRARFGLPLEVRNCSTVFRFGVHDSYRSGHVPNSRWPRPQSEAGMTTPVASGSGQLHLLWSSVDAGGSRGVDLSNFFIHSQMFRNFKSVQQNLRIFVVHSLMLHFAVFH